MMAPAHDGREAAGGGRSSGLASVPLFIHVLRHVSTLDVTPASKLEALPESARHNSGEQRKWVTFVKVGCLQAAESLMGGSSQYSGSWIHETLDHILPAIFEPSAQSGAGALHTAATKCLQVREAWQYGYCHALWSI